MSNGSEHRLNDRCRRIGIILVVHTYVHCTCRHTIWLITWILMYHHSIISNLDHKTIYIYIGLAI